MNLRKLSCGIIAAAILFTGSGCSKGPTKIKGTVLMDGNGLGGATVTFQPQGGSGRPVSGMTNDDGTFETSEPAAPGNYQVTIVKREPPKMPAGATTNDPKMNMVMMGGKIKPGKFITPERYSKVDQSGLSLTVPPSGEVKFELQGK